MGKLKAEDALAPARALCDIVTSCRITQEKFPFDEHNWNQHKDDLVGKAQHAQAQKALAHLPPFHFPVAFPEVFLRPRAGFDVLLGNPPWEKARVEEHGFWARHSPGLRSVSQREYEKAKTEFRNTRPDLVKLLDDETAEAAALRSALLHGPYPGMGTGDPDLFKAFCWRFWRLIAPDGGRCGVVLPRGALVSKGSAAFREDVFPRAQDVSITTLVNNRQWVFSTVHPQYTIGLVTLTTGQKTQESIALRGPFNSRERFDAGHRAPPIRFTSDEVTNWTDSASLPLLPAEESLGVFAQLRKHPRLDLNDAKTWRARPYRELDMWGDKGKMDLESEECPKGFWPVYKGESFDIWKPDTTVYFAWANPAVLLPELQDTRRKGSRNKKSPFSEFDAKALTNDASLPCRAARLAFRRTSRATDSRTLRVALVPPNVFLTDHAPFLLMPRGTVADLVYLLGVMSSLPLDWYARRFVETMMDFHLINAFPIPRPSAESPLRKRIIELAGRLAAVDARYEEWAKSVGVACGPLDEGDKQNHIHELDAVVAHLYGLTEPQLVHVFETFHEGWDFAARLAATLKHYHKWAK